MIFSHGSRHMITFRIFWKNRITHQMHSFEYMGPWSRTHIFLFITNYRYNHRHMYKFTSETYSCAPLEELRSNASIICLAISITAICSSELIIKMQLKNRLRSIFRMHSSFALLYTFLMLIYILGLDCICNMKNTHSYQLCAFSTLHYYYFALCFCSRCKLGLYSCVVSLVNGYLKSNIVVMLDLWWWWNIGIFWRDCLPSSPKAGWGGNSSLSHEFVRKAWIMESIKDQNHLVWSSSVSLFYQPKPNIFILYIWLWLWRHLRRISQYNIFLAFPCIHYREGYVCQYVDTMPPFVKV